MIKALYLELSNKLAQLDNIRWVDLWHEQVTFMEDEHPFPAPAIFLSFRLLDSEEMGELVQNGLMQVEVYLFYETMSDSYVGSVNQQSATSFLELLENIYKSLQGSRGENYSEMRRTGFYPVNTGDAGNLYVSIFECRVVDESAKKSYADAGELDVEVSNEPAPEVAPDEESAFIVKLD